MLFGAPAKLADGRYFLKITSDDKARVIHQVNNVTMSGQVTLNVSGHKDFFAGIDDAILTQAKASKVEWFGKEISDETISKAYQSALEGPVFQAPLATVNGKVVTVAYDAQKVSVDMANIQKDATLDILVELAGLWFLKKSFGPIFRIAQIRVAAPPVQKRSFPTEYLFDDAPQDEVEEDSPNDYLD